SVEVGAKRLYSAPFFGSARKLVHAAREVTEAADVKRELGFFRRAAEREGVPLVARDRREPQVDVVAGAVCEISRLFGGDARDARGERREIEHPHFARSAR